MTRAQPRRYDSVRQDWRSILPNAKALIFFEHCAELENAHGMFSVSLNESLGLSQSEEDSLSLCQNLTVLDELCSRFALQLNAVLHAMSQYGRHFGIIPNMDALDGANFQSLISQRAVWNSNLLARVLLSERSQFLNKLGTLEEVVDDLCDDFIDALDHLQVAFLQRAHRSGANLFSLWKCLDSTQYDLTTCLRETDVMLKSFLWVLPDDQLSKFDFTIRGLARARRPRVSTPSLNAFRARRMATAAGE